MRTVATLGSHCALQVLKGAKEEGFTTLVVAEHRRAALYRRFPFIDHTVLVQRFGELAQPTVQEYLGAQDSVLIPHGTFVSEVGIRKIERDVRTPVFGNRHLLRWEASRELKERLLRGAKIRTPRRFAKPEEIDRLAILKLPGAAGGRGYRLAADKAHALQVLKRASGTGQRFFMQEYVLGVPIYFHFFYSPLDKRLELLGIDRRYETDADAIGRLPAAHQATVPHDPAFVVVGNQPVVLRESLLDEVYAMGERFVDASQRLVAPGVIGPFCLEGVYDREAIFYCFEFSARIVAGTNLYPEGSPYSALLYAEPMSMGRRIARELREARETGEEKKVLT
jgi:5-formaminoimidazole-4-carboxamide-1-(beta)-D-ribofuranosyl 5'-monophosphate synthetase